MLTKEIHVLTIHKPSTETDSFFTKKSIHRAQKSVILATFVKSGKTLWPGHTLKKKRLIPSLATSFTFWRTFNWNMALSERGCHRRSKIFRTTNRSKWRRSLRDVWKAPMGLGKSPDGAHGKRLWRYPDLMPIHDIYHVQQECVEEFLNSGADQTLMASNEVLAARHIPVQPGYPPRHSSLGHYFARRRRTSGTRDYCSEPRHTEFCWLQCQSPVQWNVHFDYLLPSFKLRLSTT